MNGSHKHDDKCKEGDAEECMMSNSIYIKWISSFTVIIEIMVVPTDGSNCKGVWRGLPKCY